MRYLSKSFGQFATSGFPPLRHPPNSRHLAFSTSCVITAGSKHIVDDIPSTSIDGWEYPVFSSDRVRERKSVFLAHATTLPSTSELSDFIDRLNTLPVLKRATHCMYAYRVIPDPSNPSNKILGQHDGGERGSGERLSRLLDALECRNVVVVVSRWYGGVPLGSDRWRIISGVAKEALSNGSFIKQKSTDATAASTKNNTKRKKKK